MQPTSGDSYPAPNLNINPGNALASVAECQKLMTFQIWKHFFSLFNALKQFQEVRIRGAGKMLRDDDEFTKAWNNLRAASVDSILKNIESASTYTEFMEWMNRLNDIVSSPRALWNILHTEVLPVLKVTLEQSRAISSAFFTPAMVFEYGLDSFLQCTLCDISSAKDEESLIDIFYALAGYCRSCDIPSGYIVNSPQYCEFVNKLLATYLEIPDFDAHRFVWLVESINLYLHMPSEQLKASCLSVLAAYEQKKVTTKAMYRLLNWCILSTSPFLSSIPAIKKNINQEFQASLTEQRDFVRKYIFGCFVECLWDETEIHNGALTEPLQAWKLYVERLHQNLQDHSELPKLLLIDLLDDSLSYFTGYYGEVQPTLSRSTNLRRDIFGLIETIERFYPEKLPEEMLQKAWYLLYIVAVCGASKVQLDQIKSSKAISPNHLWLGLKRNATDFLDYPAALSSLSEKFMAEAEAFPEMVSFVRKNYDQESGN